jgi:hypothetical protein
MWRWLFTGFLVAHGVIHLALWVPSQTEQGRIPGHSWLLGDQRSIAVAITIVATALFVAAGAGLLFHAGWWRPLTVLAGIVSISLVIVFPEPFRPYAWVLSPLAINGALIAAILWFSWPSERMVGA